MKKILLTIVAVLTATFSASAQSVSGATGTYEGDLTISIGEPISADAEPIPGQSVQISKGTAEGTVDFALYNFSLGPMQLGDIILPAIGLTATEGGFTFADNADVSLAFLGGSIQATANLNETSSSVKGDSLTATIDVMWTNAEGGPTPIYVLFKGVKAKAQAFDGTLNLPWSEGTPWDSKNGYYNLSQIPNQIWGSSPYARDMFLQPQGWCTSGVIGISGLGLTAVAKCDTLAEGDYAITLTNNPNPFMASQIVPAYMSLGTTWATAKATIMMTVENADGGAFGGMSFSQLPDAISLVYKRAHGTANAEEPASVIAYTWKGTFTQANVPGNTNLGATTKVDMIDRDRNILGLETAEGGEVTKTDDAALVAKAEYYIKGDAAEWTELTVPFEYSAEGVLPEKLNIIISANDYFGERAKIGGGNSLSVDDIRLVYYHALGSLAYEGHALAFDEAVTDYDLSTVIYDPAKLSFTKKGQGATIDTAFDPASNILTIRVSAANIAEDATAFTEYKIRFAGSVTGIHDATADKADKGTYSLDGRRVRDGKNLSKGIYIHNGQKVIR